MATQGIVTFQLPGELVFLKDKGRALRLKPAPLDALIAGHPLPGIKPGDRVAVTGFSVMGDYTTELEDASFQTIDSPGIPDPAWFHDAAALLAPAGLLDRDALRVSTTALVRDTRQRDDRRAVDLTSAGHDFTAWLPADTDLPDAVQAGARVRVTGICTLIRRDEERRLGRPAGNFSLLVTGNEGFEVVYPASWWTTAHLVAAIGAVTMLALLAGAWALYLRQNNVWLRYEIASKRRAETELAAERRRVAADLHDTLEQTLIAANLQLTVAARSPAAAPDAARTVSLAQQLIARGQQEVRDAVWDMHVDASSPQPLSALLSRACAEAGTLGTAKIEFKANETEQALPALVVAQSVRLVREAVTNGIKHARSTNITVACEFDDTHVRLTITDDGDGFDTKQTAGLETGHFGLVGMNERMNRLGGSLEIRSAPGAGTVIIGSISFARPS